jgi:citrate lyase beta subunit
VPATRLDEPVYARLDAQLAGADELLRGQYPGESGARQPIHTVYVPADRYGAATVRGWGDEALALMDEHLDGAKAVAVIAGIDMELAAAVLPLVRAKLGHEPIEDLRVDFEDGYGPHSPEQEDSDALRVAGELAASVRFGHAPPHLGLRFRSLEPASRRRGLRTLDLFLGRLLEHGDLPPGLELTLPKVTSVAQVQAFVLVCAELENAYVLPPKRLRFEVQVETPQAILAADGSAAVAAMIHAGDGRISGLHYGTFDYSAACGVAAAYQSLAHPAADHAKAVMQVAAAGTGVRISDGSTNVLPVGSGDQVRAAWSLHAGLVRRSLERAYYQGWDMHPGHLVTRYIATYAFFRQGLPAAADRLRAYLAKTAGGTLDEPATAQAMASLLVRGLQCGALSEAEVTQRSGISRPELDALYRRRAR